MTQSIIQIRPKTYISHELIARELRNLYYQEVEYDTRLGIHSWIEISYYGLDIPIEILDDDNTVRSLIKDHFAKLRNMLVGRVSTVNKKYAGKPGMDLSSCIKLAIHNARNDIADAIEQGEGWVNWSFFFVFNAIQVEFSPIILNPYTDLYRTFNKKQRQ